MMLRLTLALIAVLGLAAGIYFLAQRAEPPGASAPVPTVRPNTQPPPSRRPAEIEARVAHDPRRPEAAGADEADALDQLEPLLRAARLGKAEAQYRLYGLLAGCQAEYAFYFGRGEGLLNKEEAAIRMEAFQSADEYAVDVYRMCHRLMEEKPELTATADDWLNQALAQGHPGAQTTRATELINAAALSNPAIGRTAPPNAERDARLLLQKAIASGDGQVLWTLGELRPMLGGPAEETNKERWAMLLASCDRGVDCGPGARWVKRYCKADPASLCPINANAEEMIRSNTGSDFEMIKMRAREINALIDSGNARQLVPSP